MTLTAAVCRTALQLILGVAMTAPALAGLPAFEAVRAAHRPSEAELLDRRGACSKPARSNGIQNLSLI